jgi:hypothetical protein
MSAVHKLPALIKQFEKILLKAQTQRNKRDGLVDLPKIEGAIFDKVPEWNVYELNIMLEAVNKVRNDNYHVLNEKPYVTLDDIRRVERGAVGHSDYSHKFSLYCAELALNLNK